MAAKANAGQLAAAGVIHDGRALEPEQFGDLAGVEQVGSLERAMAPRRSAVHVSGLVRHYPSERREAKLAPPNETTNPCRHRSPLTTGPRSAANYLSAFPILFLALASSFPTIKVAVPELPCFPISH